MDSQPETSGLWFKVEDVIKNVYFALEWSIDSLNSNSGVQMDWQSILSYVLYVVEGLQMTTYTIRLFTFINDLSKTVISSSRYRTWITRINHPHLTDLNLINSVYVWKIHRHTHTHTNICIYILFFSALKKLSPFTGDVHASKAK